MGFKRSNYPFLKTDLYRLLWSRCNALRGDMDASQYKDYVLAMLFVKWVSGKHARVCEASITIPEGASFKDMIALKGKRDIGDQINRNIIAPLARANNLSGMADFNDATKLGSGTKMVERLTKLIAIFESVELDLGTNEADEDEALSDCWEYLIGRFALGCGRRKTPFYTPPEVSDLVAQMVGIGQSRNKVNATVYDPTCGSGSLLLKVAEHAAADITLYGREKDCSTAALARMNMLMHNKQAACIMQGNSLATPLLTRLGRNVMTFDYVIAHPPFGDSRSKGIDPISDPYQRSEQFRAPLARGDFAYLLHIVLSLKSSGKGACILPQGMLFRGSSEADIRRNLVLQGYIAGIIGLPGNLFYGTGIPSCIIIIDKLKAHNRKGIFVLDASAGFFNVGRKNRLREIDVRLIAAVFNSQLAIPGYSRMVPRAEIEKNQFNLNIARYINSEAA
jgi:type I restriction enzyme M protein